jgi:predicted PurR-regulated permease PerM
MSKRTEVLLSLAAVVAIVAGLKAAADLAVLFLLTVFIAIIVAPLFLRLRNFGLPRYLALLLTVLVFVIIGGALFHVLNNTLNQFLLDLPRHQEALDARLATLWEQLETHDIAAPDEFIRQHADPQIIVGYLASTATSLSGVLSNAFLIFIVVAFVLAEIEHFLARLDVTHAIEESTLSQLKASVTALRRYVSLKTILSFVTGVAVFIWLWILGVDYPVFMGILAFLLNFVPAIGSVLAAIPGVLLAFTGGGLEQAAITAAGYVGINFAVSYILEPRLMGDRLGISPLAVVISMIVWGWILGPVGMLLSVPLTMVLHIMLNGVEGTRWFGLLIGGKPADRPKADERD